MATATEAPRGAETTKQEPAKRTGERRGTGWRDANTGKFVPKQKALDQLSA